MMDSNALTAEARSLINALGDCAISVRLLATVLDEPERALTIARWLLAEQESHQRQINRIENHDEYLNETIWLIYLSNISGYRRKTYLTAKSFLIELSKSELPPINLSLKSGIALSALICRKNQSAKHDEMSDIDLVGFISAAVADNTSAESLTLELESYLQKSEDGGYPIFWDTWRPAFLIELIGSEDGQERS